MPKPPGGFISAKIPSPVPGDVRLETGAGAIEVVVPNDAALTIDAETGIGSVHSDLPIASRTREDSDGIKGTINGGGKSLHLRSGAGSISIKSRGDSAQHGSVKSLNRYVVTSARHSRFTIHDSRFSLRPSLL